MWLDRFVYMIKRLRITVSTETALGPYHGYVSSILSYGLLLWSNLVDVLKGVKIPKSVRVLSMELGLQIVVNLCLKIIIFYHSHVCILNNYVYL